eukprot:scpid93279/ scgid7919/ 
MTFARRSYWLTAIISVHLLSVSTVLLVFSPSQFRVMTSILKALTSPVNNTLHHAETGGNATTLSPIMLDNDDVAINLTAGTQRRTHYSDLAEMRRTICQRCADNNIETTAIQPDAVERPLLAVGSFTNEQLTTGCTMFSDFIGQAQALRRDVVLPNIHGPFFVGMAGVQYTYESRRVRHDKVSASTRTRPMSDYYRLDVFNASLQWDELELVTEERARQTCRGQWTAVFMALHNWAAKPRECFENRTLQVRIAHLFAELRNSSQEQMAVERCDWMCECLPSPLRSLAPFKGILCAAVPTKFASRWRTQDISEQLDSVSSRCLMFVHWFGAWRYGLQRQFYTPPTSFRAANYITQSAKKIVEKSLLSAGFVTVHIRMEKLLAQCKPKKGRVERQCPTGEPLLVYVHSCFKALIAKMDNFTQTRLPVLLSYDGFSSISFTASKARTLQFGPFQGWLLVELKNIFGDIHTISMDELFDSSVEKKAGNLDAFQENRGLRSLLDAEV